MLYAVEHLQDEAPDWVALERKAYPDATPAQIADRARRQALSVTWLDGTISGTPFLLALVPAYVTMLLEQARMTIRMAAAYGAPARDDDLAAQLLALRGVYESVDDARAAITTLGEQADRPEGRRGWLRSWGAVVFEILVLAGFLTRKDRELHRPAPVRALLALGSATMFVLTCVFPALFMIVMGWSSDQSTRGLASAATEFYSAQGQISRSRRLRTRNARIGRRPLWVTAAIWISILIPFVLVFSASSHHPSHLVLALKPLWPLLALSLVLIIIGSRRRQIL